MDLFPTKSQLFTSQDVNWWTGVAILWCFYQLFGLSIWRHPFTIQRIHWWLSDGMMNFSRQFWWRNKLVYILAGLRVSKLSASFHFRAIYFYKYFPEQFDFIKAQQAMCYVLSSCSSIIHRCKHVIGRSQSMNSLCWDLRLLPFSPVSHRLFVFHPPHLDVCEGGYLCVWDDILIVMPLI